MKTLRAILFCIAFALTLGACTKADGPDGGTDGGGTTVVPVPEGLDEGVFDMLDLSATGLEKVRAQLNAGDKGKAAKELLAYYRIRMGVVHPDVNLVGVTATAQERMQADESLEHKFYAHSGYQPSYDYDDAGGEIDWTYWPVKDNELRLQLHRHKWFIPLGRRYRETGDEKYVEAWVEHYTDWLDKNPMPPAGVEIGTDLGKQDQYRNMRFAWRPLEISIRMQDQCALMLYFKESVNLTPEFFTRFLAMYARHADYLMDHFTASGNHLLYEAQSMVYAGTFYKEFRNAAAWRARGIEILGEQIGEQVLSDGMQYELDFGYHRAAIGTFLTAYNMSKANGYGGEFPASYPETVEKMIDITCNLLYPDYMEPLFSDNRRGSKSAIVRNMGLWNAAFPDNAALRWWQTQGAEGSVPAHLSKAFPVSGFYVLRNGWTTGSSVMVLKNGGAAFWHNQPDNGTFELWHRGRNFFPDSGSYLYSGDATTNQAREWFRQTRVHNTLTLGGATITGQAGEQVLFSTSGDTDICVTQNAAYAGLTHRRSVFFVERRFYVIVDEAVGPAAGTAQLHWNLCEDTNRGGTTLDPPTGAYTTFNDGNNLIVKTVTPTAPAFAEQEGRVSYQYNSYTSRKAYNVSAAKTAGQPVRFITVLYPVGTFSRGGSDGIGGSFTDAGYSASGLSLSVTAEGRTFPLTYTIN